MPPKRKAPSSGAADDAGAAAAAAVEGASAAASAGASAESAGVGAGKIRTIVVLMGLTGAGKSTFGSTFVQLMADQGDHTWHRVAQDVLKSPSKVEKEARRLLCEGENVVIDRTNLSKELRAVWIKMGKEFGAHVELVHLNSDKDVCAKRCTDRLVHEGGVTGKGAGRIIGMQVNSKNRSDPEAGEGFARIYTSDASAESIRQYAASFFKKART